MWPKLDHKQHQSSLSAVGTLHSWLVWEKEGGREGGRNEAGRQVGKEGGREWKVTGCEG